VVQPRACLIDDVCHPEGATVTCGRCDPAASATAWTPVSDKPCDDGSLCTKNDRCRQGVCIGEPYTCSDGLACTTDGCDGSGGCYFYLKANACNIEKTCYKALETDVTGCKVCDPASSTAVWTVRTNVCKIDGQCYAAGAKEPTGCGECDPLHAPDGWSLQPDRCLIGGECLVGSTPHPSKCAACDPKASGTSWTPVSGASLVATTFSGGLQGWIVSSPSKGVGWQTSSARFSSAPASLYYGNPATKTYDNGAANGGVATAPTVKLVAGQKAYLALRIYVDVDPSPTTDVLLVLVNGQIVWSKAELATGDYRRWVAVLVDLAPFAGQAVSVQVEFDTKSSQAKSLEGIYLDDVILLWSCGPIS
jgi:hypothetical protein